MSGRKTASLTAENTFSTGIAVSGYFNLSISGDWSGGTLTLQRAFADAPTTWADVKEYTANVQEYGNESEGGTLYRIGFKTGDYGSGTAAVRISQ